MRYTGLTCLSAGLLAISLFAKTAYGQSAVEDHQVVLGADPAYIENNHFKQGTNVDPKGVKLDLNNYFLRRGGKPILPIMGEFHYSRYPRAEWEQSLLQMKAAGIQIIALYNFWNQHEEQEGKFRFDDNRDVRYFLQLCAKHGLWAMVRIGPWAHGEARNGGFPDWYVKKRLKSGNDRSSVNGSIQPEVVAWYAELARQYKGLYYKDGGPIIGVQLDNEVSSRNEQSSGYQYMAALKALAVKDGMDVPYYVVTGWPGPVVPEDEVMPLWGGYADAPWTQNTRELPANSIYTFITDRRDKNIGNDLIKYGNEADNKPIYRHPFLNVELGSGIEPTYLRRPVLNTPDIMGLVYTRLGTGANMLGYYVFHGTQHPLSWDGQSSTQESKSSIYPYPNDYALISYDFEAPLSEWGYTRDYYHDLKLLHQFVTGYAEKLAPMFSTIPADNPAKPNDLEKLRYAVRNKGNSGFVFFNNYMRHFTMADHKQVAFTIKTPTETIRIPEKGGIDINNGAYGALPFNDNAGGVLIKYATVHPAAIVGNTYFYYAIDGITPEIKLASSGVKNISMMDGAVGPAGNFIYLRKLKPGKNCVADITTYQNKKVKLVILSHDEAKYSYVFDIKGTKTLLLTSNQTFYNELKDSLTIRSAGDPSFTFYSYPAMRTKSSNVKKGALSGIFTSYKVNLKPAGSLEIPFQQVSDDNRFNKYIAATPATPAKPAYIVNYVDTLPYKAYRLNLPKKLPANVYDELASFNYYGNTAALYANGKVIADNYYLGLPMDFSLRRHAGKLASDQFILQISPLLSKADIYFEPGTYLDFKNTNADGLRSISVKPVYQVVF